MRQIISRIVPLGRLAPLLIALCMLSSQAGAYVITPVVNDWTFIGVCSDCTGIGTGTLILQNYHSGAPILAANFVSFDYSSNLVPVVHETAADLVSITGILTLAPGGDNVDIFFTGTPHPEFFASTGGGFWCINPAGGCSADQGPSFTFAAPEPASLALLAAGVAGLGIIRRRRA